MMVSTDVPTIRLRAFPEVTKPAIHVDCSGLLASLLQMTGGDGSRLSSCCVQGVPCQILTSPKGDELVTRLHRNSAYLDRCAALASQSVTSGASDNCPVLDHRGGQAACEPGTLCDRERFTRQRFLCRNAANVQLGRCACGGTVSLWKARVPKPKKTILPLVVKNGDQ
jgi:hypothetical protein